MLQIIKDLGLLEIGFICSYRGLQLGVGDFPFPKMSISSRVKILSGSVLFSIK
ncbi:hypothetical protein [Sphingobacterium sp. BIGb0165]|uniref:hypothetical protein n=1 Tax=Sphingobacterium sp. BIGb0165 TaxID=2940615 RepID=UPI0021680146|nr:hypothetical protein [Sphingobacterium sp. BIGb0165]